MPNFEGKMLDFGGATVIFLITMGFLLAGIVGAILSLPVAMAARDIFRQYFRNAVKDSEILASAAAGARGSTEARSVHERRCQKAPDVPVARRTGRAHEGGASW